MALTLGATLAACSGFRAFLPLFLLGLAHKIGVMIPGLQAKELEVSSHFAWVFSDVAILCFATATLFEILADKFPAVDHALDSLLLVVRPGAGALSMMAVLPGNHPLVAYVAATLVGASLAIPGQTVKAGLRLGATTASLGFLNPILSIAEDLIALFGSIMAILLPMVAFLAVMLTIVIGLYLFRTLRSRSKAAAAPATS